MLRIDRTNKKLTPMTNPTLNDAGLLERGDVQRLIRQNSEVFFQEMGEPLLLLGEEIHPTGVVDDRIDLLALDPQGAVVVIELKRGHDRYQLLQALSYAAMVSEWEPQQVVEAFSQTDLHREQDAEEALEEFLEVDLADVNKSQRVILLAEGFDYEVLAAARWLSQEYGVDIRCYQMSLASDENSEYINCTCIYPPPELRDHAIKRKRAWKHKRPWHDWDSAIALSENPHLREFFQAFVDAGQEGDVSTRTLIYRCNGRRHYFVGARKRRAYVWQKGRFADDEAFWRKKLDDKDEVKPVDEGYSLRFYLESKADFQAFREFLENEAQGIEFLQPDEDDE